MPVCGSKVTWIWCSKLDGEEITIGGRRSFSFSFSFEALSFASDFLRSGFSVGGAE